MIDWMVTSSALILLVAALRAVVKGRVSPRLRYALWLVVLARLLVPGTFWESRASVMTPVAGQEAYQAVERIPQAVRTRPDGWVDIVTPGVMTSVREEKALSGETVFYGKDHTKATIESLRRQVGVRNAFLLAWAAGAFGVGLFLLAVNLRFAGRLGKNRRTLEKYRGQWVFEMDGLASPCLFGLFRPGIYLTPQVAADEAAKAHVLAHEYAHFRQGDHIWAALRGACLVVHWYNPLVWLAAYLSRRDCELSCDEGAVRLLGEEHRADYGRTLVGLVARGTTPADLARCATTMTGGKSALKERVALLVKRPRTTAVMAVLVAAACVVFAACTFTGAAEVEEPENGLPDNQEEQAKPLERSHIEKQVSVALTDWLLSRDGKQVEDYRINRLALREWQFDPDGGIQAVFESELMILVPQEERQLWWAGNTVEAEELEDEFYRDYDGWLVFWREGYVVLNPGTGEWSIPDIGTGGYDLDDLLRVMEIDTAGGTYPRFRALPEDLPTEAGMEGDWWLLLAELPGEDIGLYCGKYDEETVYLRYGETFQVFQQDLSGGGHLPEMERVDDSTIAVQYYQEGGAIGERVTYRWTGAYWADAHVGPLSEQGWLPALEDLPEALIDVPGVYQDPIWKVAELPEDDIAAYYAPETGGSWIRYGTTMQAVDFTQNLVTMPQTLVPELYFEDLDGDGEKELAVIYNTGHGTGVSIWSLTVLEWDGKAWTAHTAHLEDDIIRDFETSRTVALHPEENYTTVGFRGHTVDVDMDEMFNGGTEWKEEPLACEITGMFSRYSMENYGLSLTLAGELRPESFDPTSSYGFEYVCTVYYEEDGTFRSAMDYLDTYFRWTPKVDGSLLTPVFRDILQGFISECQAGGLEDLSFTCFAVRDVDGDGENELITQRNTPHLAQLEQVYDAYGNKLLEVFPMVTYYDNGYVTAGWSHNQGKAGDKLWPYTLYRTTGTGQNRRYIKVAAVDGWDKGLGEQELSYTGGYIPFPDEVDKDGDGFVYYIITEDGGYAPEYGTPMDYAEYANWVAVFLGANVVEPAYIPLTEENIAMLQ